MSVNSDVSRREAARPDGGGARPTGGTGPNGAIGAGGLAHRIGVIWRLEALQMLRPGTIAWAIGLAVLPAALLLAVRGLVALEGSADDVFGIPGVVDGVFFALIPGVVCLLGLLFTATSAVQSELENRTWIYLAVRPQAKLAVLLGKYLFAVTWVMAIAVAATCAAAVALAGWIDPGTMVRTVGLSVLSCLAYGGLFLLIGVAFLRVGMVVAIAYTLIVEIVLGGVPAVLNEVTIAYHIRTLFVRGLPVGTFPDGVVATLGAASGSTAAHAALILAMSGLFLGAAVGVLRMRQAAALEPD